ncbi:unnamed protein product [Ectocarpus sp. 12 AP-2014]
MAMPVRSARTTEFGEKAPTPVTIGPGSYLGPSEPTKTRPSLAAFASSQHRSWQGKSSTPVGPGPGSYGGSIPAALTDNDIRPSYCFESRAPRLAPQYPGSTIFGRSTVVQVPGPGTYETDGAPGQHGHRELKWSGPRSKTVPGVAKRFNPPSVPRREQSFGYNVDPHGKLLALPASSSTRTGLLKDSAGPGDYDTQDNSWWAGVGAAKFSKGARKTIFDQDCAAKDRRPGPGDYNPKLEPRYHLDMPGSAPFMSGVPKGDNRLHGGPGPGQYVYSTPLGVNISAGNVPNFNSCAKRGAWLRSDQCPYSEPETGSFPGPGAYGSLQDNSSFNKTAPKTLTDEKIGFSSTGRRTTAGSHSTEIPGPGQYDLDLQSIAGGLQSKRRIGCKGVFGSSGDRFRIRDQTDENVHKTPMQLWDQGKILKRVVVLRPAPKSSSSFRSETSRFNSHSAPDACMNPPATQYVRKDSFDDIVERGTKSKSKPFLSTTDRRDGGAFEVKGTRGIPGPGTYNLAAPRTAVPPPRSRAQTGPRLPQGARFTHMASRNDVGPGSHEISGSLIKKTFNITFGGAYTPAGAGRLVHRASFARKTDDAGKPSDAVLLQPAPETLGVKENLASPQTGFGGRDSHIL